MNENQFACVPEDKSQVKLTGRVNRKDIMKKAVKKENWWRMRFSSALVKPGASGNLELRFSYYNNLRSSVKWQGVVCIF